MSTSAPLPAHTPESQRERGLSAFAQRAASATEKWFPDAYIFALAGLVLVSIGALVNGSSIVDVAATFGSGFWDLTAFTLQMAMVVLTGYVVATSRSVARGIEWLARRPRTGPGAVAFVAFFAMTIALFNWGLSLISAGLLARAVARRQDIKADYRALSAAALMGLGATWALGLSSSAAQLQATPTSIPKELLATTGVLDFGRTILTWQSLTMVVMLIIVATLVAWASSPRKGPKTAQDLGIDLTDEADVEPPRTKPGEWLEYSRILPTLVGLLTVVWLIVQFSTLPVLRVLSSLNAYLLIFLVLGLVLHGTPRRFLQAVARAVPSTAGILVQFPLYASMAAILTKAQGRGGVTLSEHLSNLFGAAGTPQLFAIVIALYTMVLGLLVPSGGGKWLIEAPYVMHASSHVGLNLGWTVQIYSVAEAMPNLINPFFMLPLLSILKIKARDMVGFTFVQFVILTPLVLVMVWWLSGTFEFEPPIVP